MKTTFSSEGKHIITLIADNGTYQDSISKTYTIEISGIGEPLATTSFNIYPNPFMDYAVIQYSLKDFAYTSLDIFNVLGLKVKTLFEGQQSRGMYSYSIDTKRLNLSGGIYFVNLQIDGRIYSKKIIKINKRYVQTEKVKYQNIKSKIFASGRLSSKEEIDIISQVPADKILKAGGKIFILDEKIKLDKKVVELKDNEIPKTQYIAQ